MTWQTAVDNVAAQAVYDHVGATRESWVDYWLDTGVLAAETPPEQP